MSNEIDLPSVTFTILQIIHRRGSIEFLIPWRHRAILCMILIRQSFESSNPIGQFIDRDLAIFETDFLLLLSGKEESQRAYKTIKHLR